MGAGDDRGRLVLALLRQGAATTGGGALRRERGWWHAGQRGSHPIKARVMARRTVMNESATWRSGRATERVGSTFAVCRGEKRPSTLGHDEGVATENDGDVVVPAPESPPLEVIEP